MHVTFANAGPPLPILIDSMEILGAERQTELAKQVTVALKEAVILTPVIPEVGRPTPLEAKSAAYAPLAVI